MAVAEFNSSGKNYLGTLLKDNQMANEILGFSRDQTSELLIIYENDTYNNTNIVVKWNFNLLF